jgi:hypothetical protein
MTTENAESMTHGEMRVRMVENAQDGIKDDRTAARDIRRLLEGRSGPSDPGNARPFLVGVEVGLELAEGHVEGLNSEVMYGDLPDAYDPRAVDDDGVARVLVDIVTAANSENWGNVAANIGRLEDRLDDLVDGEDDE